MQSKQGRYTVSYRNIYKLLNILSNFTQNIKYFYALN